MSYKNATKIEKCGITCFNSFIFNSEILDPIINSDDKVASWDGDIIVYKKSNHLNKKENILGRVPVQLKSSQRQWNNKESFSIEKSDLNNYKNDGGIVLIRPIFLSNVDYKIFARILFPNKIETLINKNPRSKKVSIKLEEMEKIEYFENLLKHFLENRPYQLNYCDLPLDELLKTSSLKFQASSLRHEHGVNGLFSDNTYIYLNNEYNMLIPTSLQLTELTQEQQLSIGSNSKIYFNSVLKTFSKDNLIKVKLNSALTICDFRNELKLNFNYNDQTSIIDYYTSINFLNEVNRTGSLFIGENLVRITFHNYEYDKKLYDNCHTIIMLLNKLRIDDPTIKINEIHLNSQKLDILEYLLIQGKSLPIENSKKSHVIQEYKLFNHDVILYCKKNDNLEYVATDFMVTDLDDFSIRNKKSLTLCSRYIALPKIDNKLYEKGRLLLRYKNEIIQDLNVMYDDALSDEYIEFILVLIRAYDAEKNIALLNLAEDISNIIYKNTSNGFNTDILKINDFQIKYRKSQLCEEDIKEIIEIRNRNSEDKDFYCCCLILLDSFVEFKLEYSKMDKKNKDKFKSWPIYEIFKNSGI